MPAKYHVKTESVAPRFFPVSKYCAIESDGCLGCLECVKRESCVYDVYRNRRFDPEQVVDTADTECISCMRCVQECKKNILSRTRNPQYERLGDDYWKPELIASIWKQAETGSIPVSGAGYRGPFAGAGFDQMWTDMSEIVRPTRDGIHGREYISTTIELGRRPARLQFDEMGKLLTRMYPFIEIPIPIVLDIPQCNFVTESTRQAIAQAAGSLGTFAVASAPDVVEASPEQVGNLIARLNPSGEEARLLDGVRVVELAYSDNVAETVKLVKRSNPAIVTSIRIPLDEHATARSVKLSRDCGEVLHFQADYKGRGFGKRSKDFIIELIKEVHFGLLKNRVRDQVTILVSGGIAVAEHVAKIIACGADGIGIDTALLAALGCRLCHDCDERNCCPVEIDKVDVEWGAQRIINLIGSWHSQLMEVLGAMGIREVRRLRGELGRTMFFEDLEKESFEPLFGKRTRTLSESLEGSGSEKPPDTPATVAKPRGYRGAKQGISPCPSRFRNRLSKYRIVRTTACIACGKCVEICQYGVHRKAGKRMLAPKSYLCRGPDVCRAAGAFCVDHCPQNALRVSEDPMWKTFGDHRWTADLLVSTWNQAETGCVLQEGFEYKVGSSGGGFDKISLAVLDTAEKRAFKPEDVDLSIRLNRRNDGRGEVVIGFPIYGGGMSFGSISLITMLARARAFRAFGSFTCTGEGGYPEELKEYDDCMITQVATGLFGVKEETIKRVPIVEFKYAQGAKPGLGGHLLGDKVTPAVAQMRESVRGSALFSPFPFHSVYSVEDHKKHVDWIKQINPKALVAVKVSTPTDVDMVAVGSYYAGAHIIHLDGSYGGTGAAPDIAKKNIAMPIEYAIGKVHRFLEAEGIRNEITLIASGGLRTAWDVAKAIALGADGVVIGTSELVALECLRCGVCESGRGCPRGIATTDLELSVAFDLDWATQRLVNLFHSWAVGLQDILWRFGMKSVGELVGRGDLLRHLDYDNQPEGAGSKAKCTKEVSL